VKLEKIETIIGFSDGVGKVTQEELNRSIQKILMLSGMISFTSCRERETIITLYYRNKRINTFKDPQTVYYSIFGINESVMNEKEEGMYPFIRRRKYSGDSGRKNI